MKKTLALMITIVMLFSVAAFAEEADPVIGEWYLVQAILSGKAYYNVSQIGLDMVMTLNDDGTGMLTMNNEMPSACTWKANEAGGYVFMEVKTQQELQLKIDDKTLILGNDDQNCYIFTREKNEEVDFAQVITAEDKAAFNGSYVLTYVSGDDYTLTVENAMADLTALGIAGTDIEINDGTVKLFGQDAREFVFNEDGTLTLDNEDGLKLTNIKICALADGGLAINWLGLTFYADWVGAAAETPTEEPVP